MSVLNIDFELDDIAPGGRIGLIALATDYNSETDLRRLLPGGVELFTNRVKNENPLTIENLRAMAGDITRAADGILPGLGVDVMIYGCTSGTAAIGEEDVQRRIQLAQPGVACTNPIRAVRSALNALSAHNISILTPYTETVNDELAARFREQNLNVLNIDGFGMDDDIEMTGIPIRTIVEAGIQVCHPDADALFISCTATRATLAIDTLEQKLGRPVISSNQALAWHSLRLMGNDSDVKGFGQLFSTNIAGM